MQVICSNGLNRNRNHRNHIARDWMMGNFGLCCNSVRGVQRSEVTMAVFMVLLPALLSLVFTLSQSTSPPPHLGSPSPCGDEQNLNFNCELQELKLEITQLGLFSRLYSYDFTEIMYCFSSFLDFFWWNARIGPRPESQTLMNPAQAAELMSYYYLGQIILLNFFI